MYKDIKSVNVSQGILVSIKFVEIIKTSERYRSKQYTIGRNLFWIFGKVNHNYILNKYKK